MAAAAGVGIDAPPELEEQGRKRLRLLALEHHVLDIELSAEEAPGLRAIRDGEMFTRLKTPELQRLTLPDEKAQWK